MIALTTPHQPINMPITITIMNVMKAGCARCGGLPSALCKIDDPQIMTHKPAAPKMLKSPEASSATKSQDINDELGDAVLLVAIRRV
jgi:hypothetical protein